MTVFGDAEKELMLDSSWDMKPAPEELTLKWRPEKGRELALEVRDEKRKNRENSAVRPK
jgi:hypothetical protein